MKKIVIIIVVISFFCFGCSSKNKEKDKTTISKISTNEVFKEIDNSDAYIIDVREIDEYTTGHIKNAINVPVGSISSDLINKVPVDSKVIVYCMSGARSRIASQKLLDLGYKNIYDMGGINAWNYEVVVD